MALNIPAFDNPFDPANPFVNAYGWNSFVSLDLFSGTGRVVVNVNPSPAAWQNPPIGQRSIALGEKVADATYDAEGNQLTPEVRIKTLAELMANPTFAAAFNVIGSELYSEVQKHPDFAGSTQV